MGLFTNIPLQEYSVCGIFGLARELQMTYMNRRPRKLTARERMMTMDINVMSALAEPTRMQIVELLRECPLTVGEIAERLQLRQPQASKHLRVLSEAGIVEAEVDANRRIYRLRPDPFRELDKWLESYRVIWEQRFDRLDDYLQKLQGKDTKK
jgi:DNA-binding transcriptional ArsR family regulator